VSEFGHMSNTEQVRTYCTTVAIGDCATPTVTAKSRACRRHVETDGFASGTYNDGRQFDVALYLSDRGGVSSISCVSNTEKLHTHCTAVAIGDCATPTVTAKSRAWE
jgi:hypothetical protein